MYNYLYLYWDPPLSALVCLTVSLSLSNLPQAKSLGLLLFMVSQWGRGPCRSPGLDPRIGMRVFNCIPISSSGHVFLFYFCIC